MTNMTITDATILASLLTELRLPSIARNWKRITDAANREGWPAQKTLATLLEIEVAERTSRRIQRHRDQSETPVGKTFASFDFTAAKMVLFGLSVNMPRSLVQMPAQTNHVCICATCDIAVPIPNGLPVVGAVIARA